jgi:uncharacterized protein (TIGR02145 family)
MRRLLSIIAVLALASSCYFDYHDIDTKSESASAESTVQLDVRLSGKMVCAETAASDEENAVVSYDIYVFRISSEGNFLEYAETDCMPSLSERVTGTNDILIGRHTITLPSSGTKQFLVVANAFQNKMSFPAITTYENSMMDDKSDVSTYEQFCSMLNFNFTKGNTPISPFLMLGETKLASSVDASLYVKLSRQCTKVKVVNAISSELEISSIQFVNAPRQCWPLSKNFSLNEPQMVEYPKKAVKDNAIPVAGEYFLYTPGTLTKSQDFRVAVIIEGTFNGSAISKQFACPNPMHADYQYTLKLTREDGALAMFTTPDWSVGSFNISGPNLRDGMLTFPFKADKNWGYELPWSTNLTGDVQVTIAEPKSWFKVVVADGFLRVCVTEDNLSGSERSGQFTASLGKYSQTIALTQQTMPTQTVKFNGWEWMDRNLGATLPLDDKNILNSACYGYYYQWARNVPFPTIGEVATVPTNNTRTIAEAQEMAEFITGADNEFKYDWCSYGSPLSNRTTTWKERSGGEDPCPPGYHVPSYREYQTILPYTNAAGIGNYSTVASQVKSGEVYDDGEFDALYVTTDVTEETIYAIKRYRTESAYYLCIQRIQQNGLFYVRIQTTKGDASSDYAGTEASEILASAKAFWSAVDMSKVETLYFPACGKRNRSTGQVVDQGVNFATWAATTWDGSSSSPVTSSPRIYSMANNRSHAMPLRCIKDYK